LQSLLSKFNELLVLAIFSRVPTILTSFDTDAQGFALANKHMKIRRQRVPDPILKLHTAKYF
jgi:hypothetical protein